jgi:hypothetical protein
MQFIYSTIRSRYTGSFNISPIVHRGTTAEQVCRSDRASTPLFDGNPVYAWRGVSSIRGRLAPARPVLNGADRSETRNARGRQEPYSDAECCLSARERWRGSGDIGACCSFEFWCGHHWCRHADLALRHGDKPAARRHVAHRSDACWTALRSHRVCTVVQRVCEAATLDSAAEARVLGYAAWTARVMSFGGMHGPDVQTKWRERYVAHQRTTRPRTVADG